MPGRCAAWLCREVPGVADPPELSSVQDLLNGGSWIPQMVLSHPMLGAMDYAEQPALEPPEFQARSRTSWTSCRTRRSGTG